MSIGISIYLLVSHDDNWFLSVESKYQRKSPLNIYELIKNT